MKQRIPYSLAWFLCEIINTKPKFMKKIALLFIFSLFIFSCEKDKNEILIGKWKLVEGYSSMGGNRYSIPVQGQRIDEYTGKIKILFDFAGNEIDRCEYSATNSTINLFGVNLNGTSWHLNYDYWFEHDTLKIKNDGGFEFSYDYFVRLK